MRVSGSWRARSLSRSNLMRNAHPTMMNRMKRMMTTRAIATFGSILGGLGSLAVVVLGWLEARERGFGRRAAGKRL